MAEQPSVSFCSQLSNQHIDVFHLFFPRRCAVRYSQNQLLAGITECGHFLTGYKAQQSIERQDSLAKWVSFPAGRDGELCSHGKLCGSCFHMPFCKTSAPLLRRDHEKVHLPPLFGKEQRRCDRALIEDHPRLTAFNVSHEPLFVFRFVRIYFSSVAKGKVTCHFPSVWRPLV